VRRTSSLLVALALTACGAASPAAPPSDDAVASWAGADSQFRSILARVVFSTQSVPMAAYALGIPENCAIVRPAFDAAIAANLPAWRANLARAYRDNVPAATLAEAVAAGPSGAAAVKPYIDKVGASMQAASTPLLEQAAEAVVTPAMNAVMKIDPKSVDGAARMQQLKAAQADGSMFCGLMERDESKRSVN
jgi:hypothetical protein